MKETKYGASETVQHKMCLSRSYKKILSSEKETILLRNPESANGFQNLLSRQEITQKRTPSPDEKGYRIIEMGEVITVRSEN